MDINSAQQVEIPPVPGLYVHKSKLSVQCRVSFLKLSYVGPCVKRFNGAEPLPSPRITRLRGYNVCMVEAVEGTC